jgi:hypothetical protein
LLFEFSDSFGSTFVHGGGGKRTESALHTAINTWRLDSKNYKTLVTEFIWTSVIPICLACWLCLIAVLLFHENIHVLFDSWLTLAELQGW